jgi:hypothetical protein
MCAVVLRMLPLGEGLDLEGALPLELFCKVEVCVDSAVQTLGAPSRQAPASHLSWTRCQNCNLCVLCLIITHTAFSNIELPFFMYMLTHC